MRGIGGIYVLVGKLPAELEAAAMTDVELEAGIELQLKKAGIKVLRSRDASALPVTPCLYFQLQVAKIAELPVYAITINASLLQRVNLVRDNSISGSAHTWFLSGTTAASEQNLGQKIKSSVDLLADQFIKDYLSMNSRPQK